MTRMTPGQRQAGQRERNRARGFAGMTHGNPNTYSAGCHCDPCKAANTAWMRLYRASKLFEHGTVALFDAGCVCAPCVMADALYRDVAS